MNWLLAGAVGMGLLIATSGSSCSRAVDRSDLDRLGTTRLTIKNQAFELWIADDYGEQQQGLMHVTAEQMAPLEDGTQRGMIFVFDHEQILSFWMKNTIIPLDIAYLDSTGKVVTTYTMAPLDERVGQYPSTVPARFAIEVSAGTWSRIDLKRGDTIQLPADLLQGR